MADRYKPIFFTIISLTVAWFIVILVCLSQDDTTQLWSSGSIQPLASNNDEGERFDFIKAHDHQQERSDSLIGTVTSQSNGIHNSISHNHNFKPPLSPEFLKNLQAKHRGMSTAGILFYQFDLHQKDSLPDLGINKSKHTNETLLLGSINSPADLYIKSEGQRLFAFNLLVSNRIGLYRPLPDTRNFKCPHVEQNSNTHSSKPPREHGTSNLTNHVAAEIKLQASVIICYFKEAPSALLRTIYTVLKRSPPTMLKEVIVVDDFSDHEHDYNKIKPFVDSNLVKLVRTNKREGLIRARLFGANLAQGDVLIFLDSHVEANVGWLEPLLEAIQVNNTTISCPMIDLINAETLIYTPSPMVKGGLNWALNFKWDSVPSSDLKTYDDFVKPIKSPTMAGGLYAIDRNFFKKLGEYDRGMELWGGENIELSLRAWMCGGRIIILPCSRVGHIFRKRRPYGPEPDQPDSLLINSHRVARVWLDDYIYKFYEASPDAKYLVSGDVTQRLELRKQLECRNFTWYLDNIYPSLKKELIEDKKSTHSHKRGGSKKEAKLFSLSKRIDRTPNWTSSNLYVGSINSRMQRQVSLDHQHKSSWMEMSQVNINISGRLIEEDNSYPKKGLKRNHQLPLMVAQFQIQSAGSNFCIESKGGFIAKSFNRLVLNHCAPVNRNSDGEILINNSTILDQLWTETELHDYRLGDNQCLDLIKNLPLLRACHSMGSFQLWSRRNRTVDTIISNPGATLCLGVERLQIGEPLIVTICEDEEQVIENPKQADRKFKQQDRPYPGWRTRPTHITRRLMSVRKLKALKPNQRWNLLFIVKPTSTPTDSTKQTPFETTDITIVNTWETIGRERNDSKVQ